MSNPDRPLEPPPPAAQLPAFQAYLVPVGAESRAAEAFTLRDLFLALVHGWKPIVLLTVLGAVVGVTTALVMTPVYRAQVVVVPREDSASGVLGRSIMGQLGGLAGLAGGMLPTGTNEAETLATLRSRALTERFIKERNLLPVLFERSWDEERQSWKQADPQKVPVIGDAYTLFDRRIRAVVQDRKTGLITVSIEWTDPVAAADWANELVSLTNESLRQRAIKEATDTLSYLNRELARTDKVELRASLFQLVEMQQKTLMLANTRPDFALRVIDPAQTPGARERIRPKRPLIAAAVTMLGALVGCAVALLLSVRRRRVTT